MTDKKPFYCIRPTKLYWGNSLIEVTRIDERPENKGVLTGGYSQCGTCMGYLSGYNGEDLRDTSTTPLTEITVEKWEPLENDDWKFKLTEKVTYEGFNRNYTRHSNPDDSICACICNFSWTNKIIEKIDNGPVKEIKMISSLRKPYSTEIIKSL